VQEAGFTCITLDLQGYRSGSLNEAPAFGSKPPAARDNIRHT